MELKLYFGTIQTEPAPSISVKLEGGLQSLVRLEASKKNIRLFRNNVGVDQTEDGRFIRYGLANDSSKLNSVVKSSDLIGIRPVKITPGHVGHTIGQFIARECKRPGWKFTGSKRENAQLAFIQLVASLGGDAAFVNRENTL